MQRNDRPGSILIVLLLLLPVIILFVGFSIDLAHMQRVRTELRSATDLATKAAACALSRTGDEANARQVAMNIGSLNFVSGQSLTIAPSDVVFGRSIKQPNGSWNFNEGVTPKNAVHVVGSRTALSSDGSVAVFFGSLYGRPYFEPEFQCTAAFIDLDICIVLDRSSSMKFAADDPNPNGMPASNPRFCSAPYADSRWAALDAAIQVFLTELESTIGTEQAAMVTFASDNISICGETNYVVTVDQGLTTNLSLVTSAMNARSTTVWNGNTDIEAGVVQAHQVLTGNGSRDTADQIMIVFTDGQYTENNPVAAGAAAHADGINIYTITFSPGANQSDMQDLAYAGKGQHFHADDPESLNDIFRQLAASLSIIVQ